MAGAVAEVERGRELYRAEAWLDAYESLSAADQSDPLGPEDLKLFATSAYMLGREAEYLGLLERAHRAHLDSGRPLAALRCAFWISVNLASRGEVGQASGWLSRAQRLLDEGGGDRVERGYLLLPVIFEQEASGELDAAAATASEAAAIGERFGDADLLALAAHEHGHILIRLGRIKEGLRLLDETMVAVDGRELSPIVSGIVYCGVILACQDAHEVRRAQEWTFALSGWCQRQPDLVAFTGRCLTHRAELMQLHGAWSEALEEARRAEDRCLRRQRTRRLPARPATGRAKSTAARRLRARQEAYREASRRGREPQPGLALLRLAQGKVDAAAAAIRRTLAETAEPGRRAKLLPAYVEIMLAAGDLVAARDATAELWSLAAEHEHGMLGGMAAQARGAVDLADGDPAGALVSLRHAEKVWLALEAPVRRCARTRACWSRLPRRWVTRTPRGSSSTRLERHLPSWGPSRTSSRVGALCGAAPLEAHGLTERELQVLRLIAAGKTNRAIAAELVLSERTVDRHVSNIFGKLRVSSRAAATASAYKYALL